MPFVTLEGIEGSGKSTLLSNIAAYLEEKQIKTLVTREPGATALGKTLRNILLNPETKNLSPSAELFLFCADRAQHIQEVISPALERGEFVLCDRFTHSTIAYQGYGRGMSIEMLNHLNKIATGGLAPDRVLLLDLDPKDALERVRRRAAESQVDRFEQLSLDFHNSIRRGFLEMATADKKTMRVIDANANEATVFENARIVIDELLG